MKVLAAFVVVALVRGGLCAAASPTPMASGPVQTPSIFYLPSTSPASQAPSASAIEAELYPRGIGDVLFADLHPGLDVRTTMSRMDSMPEPVCWMGLCFCRSRPARTADFSLDAVDLQVRAS